jgi:hypothetical protein
MGGTHYPIVSEDASSCLIEAPDRVRLRGYADIYDGDRHRAHCLVVLSQSEGAFLRVIYKRRTEARSGPAPDYPAEPPAIAGDLEASQSTTPRWGLGLSARRAFRRGADDETSPRQG